MLPGLEVDFGAAERCCLPPNFGFVAHEVRAGCCSPVAVSTREPLLWRVSSGTLDIKSCSGQRYDMWNISRRSFEILVWRSRTIAHFGHHPGGYELWGGTRVLLLQHPKSLHVSFIRTCRRAAGAAITCPDFSSAANLRNGYDGVPSTLLKVEKSRPTAPDGRVTYAIRRESKTLIMSRRFEAASPKCHPNEPTSRAARLAGKKEAAHNSAFAQAHASPFGRQSFNGRR